MFLSEVRGLTHWMLLYDGTQIYAWNVVRLVLISLTPFSGLKAIAVDSNEGILFLADSNQVQRWHFVVDRGEDLMSPSLKLVKRPQVIFQSAEEIQSITVDSD